MVNLTDATLSDVIREMKDVYRSIDIRAAIGRQDEEWLNILTVIRFSQETTDELRTRHESQEARLKTVSTQRLKILKNVFSITEWDQIRAQLSEGTILINGTKIGFDDKKSLDSLRCNLTSYPSYLRKTYRWNVFEGVLSSKMNLQKFVSTQDRDIRILGFPDTYAAIGEWLEVRYDSGVGSDVMVAAPVLATLDDVDLEGSKVHVRGTLHHAMTESRLNLFLWKGTGVFPDRGIEKTNEIKHLRQFTLDTRQMKQSDHPFRTFEIVEDIPGCTPSDYLDVRLIFAGLEMDSKHDFVYRHLERKSSADAAFYRVFTRFCADEELRKQTLDPHSFKIDRKANPDAAFRRGISWLLSLSGLNAVRLDEYEKLKAEKIEIDSVDVLAFAKDRSTILLAACTVGVPKVEEDTHRLGEVKRRLHEELFQQTNVHITPVIFSPTRELGLIKEKARPYGIKIIDGNDIERLMAAIREGQSDGVASILLG